MNPHYIRSTILACFPKVIESLGHDPLALLNRSKIDPQLLYDPDATISHAAFVELLNNAATATNCKHLGLLLGKGASLQNFGVLGLLLKSSRTVGEVIRESILHSAVHTSGITRELQCGNEVAFLICVLESPEMSQSTLSLQMSVALSWQLNRLLTQNACRPTSIHFSFSEPENSAFYHQFFEVPVMFNMENNGIIFRTSDLEIRLPEHDPLLHLEMKRQVKKIEKGLNISFENDVNRLIRNNMDVGVCSIDSVVQYFPFGKRTFQGKLKKIGISYQEMLDDIRFQKAEFHLKNSDISITQLTDLLCFKSVSIFSTAFNRRYGVSPSIWRKEKL